jgi:hypothetical protein
VALHTTLPIYKVAYDLLNVATGYVRDMPRSVKPFIGTRMFELCSKLVTLVRSANIAKDKRPHLEILLERLGELEVIFRLCQDNRYISRGQYASAIVLTASVGKQANGWRNRYAASPVV